MEVSDMKISPILVMFFLAAIIASPLVLALGSLINRDAVENEGIRLCK